MEKRIDKPYATITELKENGYVNKNELRVYPHSPGMFCVQIRTHKGIGDFSTGKARNMIASVNVSIQELEDILNTMKTL